jgi:hypothetical protein
MASPPLNANAAAAATAESIAAIVAVHNNTSRDLDDDDENGSKAGDGDYEDVRCFDEENDLQILSTTAAAVATHHLQTTSATSASSSTASAQAAAALTSMAPTHIGGKKETRVNRPHPSPVLDFGGMDPAELEVVERIVSIPWPAAAGKRPPRDMKRLDTKLWSVVCKVMKWGDTPALFMRHGTLAEAEVEFGFYKPPVLFHTYPFQVGDRLQLTTTGYSASRNKIATAIKVCHFLCQVIYVVCKLGCQVILDDDIRDNLSCCMMWCGIMFIGGVYIEDVR